MVVAAEAFLIQPTAFNPERYVPYRLLWVKVIIRAAYDFALWKDSRDLRLRKYAQDAEKWLFEPSTLVNSFENICYLFGLDIKKIRQYAQKLTKEDVKKLEFRERQGKDPLLVALGSQKAQDGDSR